MTLQDDYRDILRFLDEEGAKYLLVGAYALAAYGFVRASLDIDIFILAETRNSEAVYRALAKFGAPLEGISSADFQNEDQVFQIGINPVRIDILTSISGVTFDEAWEQSKILKLDDLTVRVLSIDHLIKNKKAAGRPKDKVDVITLEDYRKSV